MYVAVKADKVQSAGKSQKAMIAKLEQAGIPVEVSTQSRLLHHKFAVVDGRWVITGSFN
jgi:phosphatidylserine/phosphatidylglycerophosphate/cardiolipin synthase-like enzyme